MKYNLQIIPHVSDSNSSPFIEFKLFSDMAVEGDAELKNATMTYFDGITAEQIRTFGENLIATYEEEQRRAEEAKFIRAQKESEVTNVLNDVPSSFKIDGTTVSVSIG